MREIKFRWWNGQNMICHENLQVLARNLKNMEGVMQFTGLFDKEGKEIYEGDIIKSNRTSLNYQVVWVNEGEAQFVGVCVEPEKDFAMCAYSWHENEIIGNVHENPESLES